MNNFLKNIFRKDVYTSIPHDDILARQRYLLFRIYSAIGVGLFFIFSLEQYSLNQINEARIFIYSAIALTLFINYVGLQFHKNITIAYIISIITGIALIHCATYYSGGIRNPDFFYMGSIILYAYIVLENRGGKLTMLLCLANILYFYAITEYSAPGKYISSEHTDEAIDLRHLYSAVTSMILITFLSSYLEYAKNAVIKRVQESKLVLQKKNEELQELSLVASETANSVIILDSKGKVEWANEGFRRLTGYNVEDVIGKESMSFLFGPKTNIATAEVLDKLLFETNNFTTEIIKYKKDGELIWVQENITRVHDDDGSIKYFLIETDITDRKKSEHKMSEYLKNLEKTNKELDKFAYVVSHDLKAPLRAIGNLTGWIEEDAGAILPDGVRENFNLIKQRVIRMEALINGILDYSKAAKKNNQYEIIDLHKLVTEWADLLDADNKCNFKIEKALPQIFADKVKVQQVFMNLIGNAIKFNNKPNKEVYIDFTQTKDHFQFSVRDNGPGIDPRFHDKIFVIFQTVNTRDDFESTGVGLAIVKKIIEENGGKIWMESEPNHGATFHFTWPKHLIPVIETESNLVQEDSLKTSK